MADSIEVKIRAILDSKEFQDQIEKIASKSKKVSDTSSKSFGGLKTSFLAVTAAVAGGIAVFNKITSVAKEFESGIARVASVAGAEATPALTKFARDAAVQTQFTAKEAADALFFLASAGLEVKDMAKVLTPSLNLATAGNLQIAEATDLVVNNLSTFKKQGLEAQEAVDILARTNQIANTDVRQLGEALKYAGGTANLVGVSFKDTNAIIGALSNQGLKGSEAGTKLRQTFAQLLDPTKEAQEALAKYGISTDEVRRLLPTPIELFKKLHDANIDNADAVKILGVRQLSVFNLIKNGIPDLVDMRAKLEDVGGAAQKSADVQLNTLEGQFKLLKSAADEVILSLTTTKGGMIDSFKNLTKEAVNTTREFAEWLNTTKGVKTVSAGFAVLTTIVKAVATQFVVLFDFVKLFLTPLIEGIKSTVNAFNILRDDTLTVKEKFSLLKDTAIDTFENIKEESINTAKKMIEDQKSVLPNIKDTFQKITDAYNEQSGIRAETYQEEQKGNITVATESLAELEALEKEHTDKVAAIREELNRFTNELNKKNVDDQIQRLSDLAKGIKLYGDELIADEVERAAIINAIQEAITKKQSEEIEKRLGYFKSFTTGVETIGDSLLTIEKNRLDTMDTNDEEAIKKQKSRITEIARVNKRVKQATAVIDAASAILKTMASVPFPFNIPLAIAQGVAGGFQVAAIESTPIPEFQKGTERTRKGLAMLHDDERIIPAGMNIPNISNAELINAALRGLNMSPNNVLNTTRTNNSKYISVTGNSFNLPNVADRKSFIDEISQFQENTNSRIGMR